MITVRAKLLDALGFLRFVVRRWTEDRCPQIAGSLAFTTLLSLVPIFAIVVALLSSAPFFEEVLIQIKVFLLLSLVPDIAGRIITVYMEEFRENAGRLTTVGVGVLFATALALMLTIDRSINAIWRVRQSRPWWISVGSYVLLLTLGPVLIGVSVSVTTYLMMSIGQEIPGVARQAHGMALSSVPLAVSAFAFFLLYRLVPHRRVDWRHALVGGVMAALLFELAKQGFAVYVRHAPALSVVYGAFAVLPFFLLWLYLSWLVVLLGAELAASLDYWVTGEWKRVDHPAARIGDAVAVARELFQAHGAALSFEEIRRATGMPVAQLDEALQHMTASGLVQEVGRNAWRIPEAPRPEAAVEAPPRLRKGKRGRARSGRSSR